MQVFFLSDLHLENGTSPGAARFVSFLNTQPMRGDALILGGDIFDLLVGNKVVFRERFRAVIDALVAASSRGVRVHYLEGNHDFHFSAMFGGYSNISVHTGDFDFLTPHGRRIYVSHGDLIDEDDTGYRLLRAATKNGPFRAFVAALPGRAVDLIGSRSSGASRKYTTGRVENEGTERLRRIYLDFARGKVSEGFHHVLVGHSHLRDLVEIEGKGEYVNLGFSASSLLYAVLPGGAERFEARELS